VNTAFKKEGPRQVPHLHRCISANTTNTVWSRAEPQASYIQVL